MKKFQKLMALLLVVVMVLGLSVTAFAAGTLSNPLINGESAAIEEIDGIKYVRATLNGTDSYSVSEYSLRNAWITFTSSSVPSASGVTFVVAGKNRYTAKVDLYNRCQDVKVSGTVYRFAAGLKNGPVAIDAKDTLNVTFTINDVTFRNKAVNVQNPNIGTSTRADGWTGIAYTASGTLAEGTSISRLNMTVSTNEYTEGATISGAGITPLGGNNYHLNLSLTDKKITVSNNGLSRDYYVAATIAGSGKIIVTIAIDPTAAESIYPTQANNIIQKMEDLADEDNGIVHLEMTSGQSVYDALAKVTTMAGISLTSHDANGGIIYVTGIGNIYPYGDAGWLYGVNDDNAPMIAANLYVLTNGDMIRWYYGSM